AASHTGGNGHITGKLLDGTNKNAPLAGQKVTLQMAQGSNAQDLATATTDAGGAYSFSNLATDKTITYALYIRYQGAQYVSDLITLATKPEQQANLTVYQATSSSDRLAVLHASLLLHEPDTRKGTITISEIFSFKNLDTHAYVGSLDASKGKPNALLFSLPNGASSVKLGGGFEGYQVIQVDSGFATDAAVPPGDSQFSFSFEVPYHAATYDFAYTAMYPTLDLSVLVPTGLQASSGALSAQGVVTQEQRPYRVFDTKQLLRQQAVHLNLSGLPTPAGAAAPAPVNTGWIWLVAGILLMVAILLLTVMISRFLPSFGRKRGKGSASRQRSKSRQQRRAASGRDETKPREAKKATDRRQVLLQELLELDKSFEAGKLNKATYQERRAKAKARLRHLMSEEEAVSR
ncbi:MAG: carboxypeptidase regulatory-like domain-containing protein, partial [Ktedonobacteraceae bacterium]|nr:carboxypeptidase regulatory-like domain-containing protein [Ktedonobacteraceae bacterium]